MKKTWTETTYTPEGKESWTLMYEQVDNGIPNVVGYIYCPYIPIVKKKFVNDIEVQDNVS